MFNILTRYKMNCPVEDSNTSCTLLLSLALNPRKSTEEGSTSQHPVIPPHFTPTSHKLTQKTFSCTANVQILNCKCNQWTKLAYILPLIALAFCSSSRFLEGGVEGVTFSFKHPVVSFKLPRQEPPSNVLKVKIKEAQRVQQKVLTIVYITRAVYCIFFCPWWSYIVCGQLNRTVSIPHASIHEPRTSH